MTHLQPSSGVSDLSPQVILNNANQLGGSLERTLNSRVPKMGRGGGLHLSGWGVKFMGDFVTPNLNFLYDEITNLVVFDDVVTSIIHHFSQALKLDTSNNLSIKSDTAFISLSS